MSEQWLTSDRLSCSLYIRGRALDLDAARDALGVPCKQRATGSVMRSSVTGATSPPLKMGVSAIHSYDHVPDSEDLDAHASFIMMHAPPDKVLSIPGIEDIAFHILHDVKDKDLVEIRVLPEIVEYVAKLGANLDISTQVW